MLVSGVGKGKGLEQLGNSISTIWKSMNEKMMKSLLLTFVALLCSLYEANCQVSISPLSAVIYDNNSRMVHTHLYVLSCGSPVDVLKGSGTYQIDKEPAQPFPESITLYYEHQVDHGCAGYNVVFSTKWDSDTPQSVKYTIWASNTSNPTYFETDGLTLPITLLTVPEIDPSDLAINISVFNDVGFTAQGDTHIHLVLNTYPPRTDYIGFVTDLACDGTPVRSNFQPSQFEHTFDVVDGMVNSRYNLSWMMSNVVCSRVSYAVTMSCFSGSKGSLPHRVITTTSVS